MTADAIIHLRIDAKGTDGQNPTNAEKLALQISRGYEAAADSHKPLRQSELVS
jgi:hypothetical protein